jgi:hypothetical protein
VRPSGRDAGKWTVVTLSGAVDTAGAARLERILTPKSMYRTRLVVDMGEVTLLGPARPGPARPGPGGLAHPGRTGRRGSCSSRTL